MKKNLLGVMIVLILIFLFIYFILSNLISFHLILLASLRLTRVGCLSLWDLPGWERQWLEDVWRQVNICFTCFYTHRHNWVAVLSVVQRHPELSVRYFCAARPCCWCWRGCVFLWRKYRGECGSLWVCYVAALNSGMVWCDVLDRRVGMNIVLWCEVVIA